MPTTYQNIVPTILATVPEVEPLYREHLKDYDELLPHVFFGDLTRFAVDAYKRSKSGESGAAAALGRLLAVLEDAIAQPDPQLQNLVTVSFLENLFEGGHEYDGVKALLGSNLKRALATLQS